VVDQLSRFKFPEIPALFWEDKMKVGGDARQAIRNYINQGNQQVSQTNQTGGVNKVSTGQEVTELPPMVPPSIGAPVEPILNRPPALRYGLKPPTPEDPETPIKMKYGIMPRPPVDDNITPIRPKYGIFPKPINTDQEG
jgi:hypothetical protein